MGGIFRGNAFVMQTPDLKIHLLSEGSQSHSYLSKPVQKGC